MILANCLIVGASRSVASGRRFPKTFSISNIILTARREMAAEFKKIVIQANPFHSQYLDQR